MPTILSHPAVPLAIGLGLGQRIISHRLLAAGAIASILPDLDVITFKLGIAYGSDFGHRGFSHSLMFAAAIALAGMCGYKLLNSTRLKVFLFLFLAVASHPILDAFTTGGHGVALLWPFSSERFFAPWQMIRVSPIGVSRFLTARGAVVLASELVWIWIPCAVLAATLWKWRTRRGRA